MREWLALREDVQRDTLEAIATGLGSDFQLVQVAERLVERKPPSEWDAASLDRHHDALATTEHRGGWTLRHSPTGTALSFVPGGASAIGIGDEEFAVLEEACTAPQCELFMQGVGRSQPARSLRVEPFLLASAPATGRSLEALGVRLDNPRVSRLYSGPHCITYLDPSELGGLLASSPFRLPTEVEWEHACRAGTTTPFFWGTDLPTRPNSGRNPLGLSELGNHPEACAGPWRSTWARPSSPSTSSWVPVRGGAAAVYPWQDCGEWLLMLSGWRWAVDPDGDTLDRQVCVRWCLDLPAP